MHPEDFSKDIDVIVKDLEDAKKLHKSLAPRAASAEPDEARAESVELVNHLTWAMQRIQTLIQRA